MRENEDTKLFYDAWYESPRGRFALAHKKRLLQKMLSPWPRRGHSLLEVGCGGGRFLELFWECGFDVAGLEASPVLLQRARERLGPRADLHLGCADLLPYENNSVDYVVLIHVLELAEDPEAVLAEALRVGAKGVIVGFLNRWSLLCLCKSLPWTARAGIVPQARWRSWWSYYRLARALQPECGLAVGTALHGLPCSWRENSWCAGLNAASRIFPVGSFGVLRIDHGPLAPRTPLVLRLRRFAGNRVMCDAGGARAQCPRFRP